MPHPKDVGDRSQLTIMFALERLGYGLSMPFGENVRYDLVVDNGTRLSRVQCKTGRLRGGAVIFNLCSNYGHHPNPSAVRRPYHGEVDEFAVFCPQTRGVYLIPISDLPGSTYAALRVETPRNNQVRGIRLAAAYEIAKIDVY